ncbi:ATP synthase F1 subunit delta [Planctomicrobium sp. SH668]|uniref:ATP synthase F1 subunit delta n=1 Tax=Planctomicrobium sp. SH668 TaxID=3448126 RepID=UPI003F5B8990
MSEATTTRSSQVLEDPSAKAVARVYALAYLNAATTAGEADPLEEIQSFQDDVLNASPQFAEMLTSQFLNRDQKLALISKTIEPHASAGFSKFLMVLIEHDRAELFPVVLESVRNELEVRRGQVRVQVKSAVSLSEEQLNRIKNRLQSALKIEPILIPTVDESLIGGLVIQVGDTVYDGSLKTRLTSLRQRLRKGYLHEIQSGRNRFSHPEGN